jgi:tetratricopeptide (TPR) repeat protein
VVWGIRLCTNGLCTLAEDKFRKAVLLDRSNPLAFHFLGELLFRQNRWMEAEIIFNYAVDNYLDSTTFKKYCDSLGSLLPELAGKKNVITVFRSGQYKKIEDRYFLAVMYEKWGHFAEAEEQYKIIINMDPNSMTPYYRLWNLQEKIGHFADAETLIRSYGKISTDKTERELSGFYQRMINRYKDHGDWYYKAGIFLYQLIAEDPDRYSEKYNDDMSVTRIEDFLDKEPPGNRLINIIKELNSSVVPSPEIKYPKREGLKYLSIADSLIKGDDFFEADINFKIGDLNVWLGSPERAVVYYQKSIDQQPGNAGARLKLINALNSIYHFQDAMVQLDSVVKRNEINFSMLLLLTKYCIHSGLFTRADTLLTTAKKIHPFMTPEISDLFGRRQLLSGNLKKAIPVYKSHLAENENDISAIYTIARLYAQTGNKKEAWKWLEESLKKGFNYLWVLQFDLSWKDFRKTGRWINLISGIHPKHYSVSFDN